MQHPQTSTPPAVHAATAETPPASNPEAGQAPKIAEPELRHHDMTVSHAIDIDVSSISVKRALRHLPVLPGIEMRPANHENQHPRR